MVEIERRAGGFFGLGDKPEQPLVAPCPFSTANSFILFTAGG